MSNQLLSECGLRWRLGKHFRSAALLDIMIQRYRAKAILIEDVFLVFRDALKLFKSSLAMKRADCDYFAAVIKSLESRLLDHLSCFTDDFRTISPDNARYADAKMQMITYMLSEISNLSGLLKISTSQKQIETPGKIRQEILHKLSCAVVVRFDFLTTIASRKAGVTDLKRLTLLSKLVNEDINKFEIYYPTPILKDLDVGGPQQQQQQQQPVRDSSVRIKNIATDTFLKYIILEMENIKHGGLSSYQINETLDLYKAIRLLYEICEDSESP